jgi:hypothetical protein
MKYTMNRNVTVSSRFGHAIAFVKGEAAHVPPEMAHEVLAAGGVPEDIEKVAFADQSADKSGVSPTDPKERSGMIAMALLDIEKAAHRDDFSATGVPKVKPVEKLLGFEVSAKEIAELWSLHLQAKDGK